MPIGDETKYWVLSFGANAKVVKPKELREKVAGKLKMAVGQYTS